MQTVNVKTKEKKGQTTMIVLVFMLLLFLGMGVFLFSLADTVSQEDYMDIYVNNLLLSVMRTDTGYDDIKCKKISDVVSCALVTPYWICGDSDIRCNDIAEEKLSEYIGAFETISQNYRYALRISTNDYIPVIDGEFTEYLVFGDNSLADPQTREEKKIEKRTANYAIQKRLSGNNYNLKLTLFIAKKGSEE